MLTLRRALVPAVLMLTAVPATAAAQVRPGTRDTVPAAMLPPAGKCRVWMSGVPASQQPAPTDCPTALRQRTGNAVILYGPTQKSANSGRFDPAVGKEPESRRKALAEQREARLVPAAERDAAVKAARERPVVGRTPAVKSPVPPKAATAEPSKKKPESQ